MGRAFFAGIVGLVMVGFCFLTGAMNFFRTETSYEDMPCELYLERPEAAWLKLEGCGLDVDELVLETADGTLERFSERKEGVARHPWPEPPTWTAAYAPVVSTSAMSGGPIRVVYRLADGDVLRFLNAWERADDRKRQKLLERPDVLLRVARPGVLSGHAERAANADAVQASLGTRALPGLLVVIPGQRPKPEIPVVSILLGIIGSALVVWAMVGFMRRSAGQPEGGDDLRHVDVSKVDVQIGALDELRREEQAKRAKRRK